MMSDSNRESLLSSGVAPIDERLGGLTISRAHLLTGPPGSGKTAVCIAFLGAALRGGKSAAMLTHDDARDVVRQAADLGVDLQGAAASGRFTMVRYAPDFVARLGRAIGEEPLADELVRLLGPSAPDALAIDSVAPFLDVGMAAGPGVAALARALDRLQSTAIVTYSGDVRDYYDRRLDPLVRRCVAVLHLSSYGEGIGRLDVVKSRAPLSSDAPSFFSVRPGQGVMPLDGTNGKGPSALPPYRGRVAVFAGVDGLPDDLLAALEDELLVTLQTNVTIARADPIAPDTGAVLVVARWDAFDDASLFLTRVRQSGNRTPVVLVTRGDVRAGDRARMLLAGFDDVVTDAIAPVELVARVRSVIRRGRSATVPVVAAVGKDTASPVPADARLPLMDHGEFARAVSSAANAGDGRPSVFSLVLFSPDEGELDGLAATISGVMRTTGGDLVGIVGDRVGVMLAGTRLTDAEAFVRRVREAWRRRGRRELRVTELAHPVDRDRLRVALGLSASSSVHGATSP